ncbi:unnamed protein product [Heligmosomoides polygyrus]|uniref:Uncharacterized protein n=1 Tax=Heligmosomoides polygyrus TaxID=6339 RepID=A0A3P8G532_HELPZ|nr:unnamed protein product [Heligmosomoides polygyrus]
MGGQGSPECDATNAPVLNLHLFTEKPRSKNRVGKEIGKEMADKSKGLFAAEDWVCSNTVWVSCNSLDLKQFSSSGYGGGFNDRQDIEYVRRDTEDEFDEFGRKRKRKDEAVLEKYDLTADPEIIEKKIEIKRPPRPVESE